MVLDRESRVGSLGLELGEDVVTQRRSGPDRNGLLRQPVGACLDLFGVPGVERAEPLVEAERAVAETSLHVALLGERVVGVFGVVARRCEVPQGVQQPVLDVLPVRSERCLPLLGEVLVLRHDVLDRVVLDGHVLLAPVVLQHP